MTIYMLTFAWPWDNHSINFSTGIQLELHKCSLCMGCKIGFDFLGFGLHFAAQRGKRELMERRYEA